VTVFVVLSPEERPGLVEAIGQSFANENYKLGPGQWLVSAKDLTTQGVVEKLGAQEGKLGHVAAFAIGNYWGYHSKNMWEWLKLKSG
jgi:hypothetical protein